MPDLPDPSPRSRRLAIGAGAIGSALVLALAAGWIERRPIAAHFIDDRLAAAGVPARYRLTTLGPMAQTIEDVRIGDPAHPDLIARRIDLRWRYGLAGPSLHVIRADGLRLSGRWRNGRLSLGAIDRLLPKSSAGGAMLPDIVVTLNNTHVALRTRAGPIGAWIAGSGRLARDFHGTIRIDAPVLAASGCTIAGATGAFDVRIADRVPHLVGPIGAAGAECPTRSLRIGAGKAMVNARIASPFDRVFGRMALTGFAGSSGTIAFGVIGGAIDGNAGTDRIDGHADLTLARLAAPVGRAAAAAISGRFGFQAGVANFVGRIELKGAAAPAAARKRARAIAASAAGTPVGPIADRIGRAAEAMAAASDIDARVALTGGPARTLRIARATIRTRQGGTVILTGDFADKPGGGWSASGNLRGETLPQIDGQAARSSPRGPIAAEVRMTPYSATGARIAITPLRIVSAGGTTRFATIATIDGPIGTGSIEGLTVPVAGTIDHTGAMRVGDGCNAIAVRRARLTSVMIDPVRIMACGGPILTRDANGIVRVAIEARDVVLTGRSGAAPITVRADRLGWDDGALAAARVAVTLGSTDDPTRLTIGALSGAIATTGLAGTFADAAGSIGTVPLALSGAAGTWRLAGGALRLEGAIGVADRAAAARFVPLASSDVALALVDGKIDASASLRPQAGAQRIATVTLHHDLSNGTGGARIDVTGISFARGGLQPEMLTPLTLGVVANVSGTIAGAGRIDWRGAAVTSSGRFHSDGLDLAAAFGPVGGLAGTITFTDLLGLVTAPHQEARIAAINPGVIVADGVAHYQLLGGERVQVEDARWPFAGGTLVLDPATLDFTREAERHMTFRVTGLDAAAFIQQLDFPNIAATGTFDGLLPMVFDQAGGRIALGRLAARGPGTLAYIGELSNAQLGTMGKTAFEALKAIRYSSLDISLDGKLDGEIISRVRFEGVRQATGDTSFAARLIRNLPFRFNIQIRAPFRGLVGSARSYANPALLLQMPQAPPVQPADSAPAR